MSTGCQFLECGVDAGFGNPQKTAVAGIAQLVEHLICNRVLSEQSQQLGCQLSPDSGVLRGAFRGRLSTKAVLGKPAPKPTPTCPCGSTNIQTGGRTADAFRLLVCGGRDYDDRDRLFTVLDRIAAKHPNLIIIHGGAGKRDSDTGEVLCGADLIAGEWARARGHFVQEFLADWDALGRAAGPTRNQEMIDEGKPDGAVAFRGGRGTADMVRRLKAAEIKTLDLEHPLRHVRNTNAGRTALRDGERT